MFPIADIDDVTLAFPAGISHLMPAYGEIPEEFRRHNGTRWNKVVSKWFFLGIPDAEFEPKEGVDGKKALRHLSVILRSYEPKHEHKEAAVAYLMSQWFDDVKGI